MWILFYLMQTKEKSEVCTPSAGLNWMCTLTRSPGFSRPRQGRALNTGGGPCSRETLWRPRDRALLTCSKNITKRKTFYDMDNLLTLFMKWIKWFHLERFPLLCQNPLRLNRPTVHQLDCLNLTKRNMLIYFRLLVH